MSGSALRRKTRELDSTSGAGNIKPSKFIPRFIRLSALVAAELGREARGEEEEVGDKKEREKLRESSGSANWCSTASTFSYDPRIQLQTRMFETPYVFHWNSTCYSSVFSLEQFLKVISQLGGTVYIFFTLEGYKTSSKRKPRQHSLQV